MAINAERVPLSEFNPDSSIKRWWDTKLRRPNQSVRRPYAKHTPSTSAESSDTLDSESMDTDTTSTRSSTDSEQSFVLDDWNDFIL